MTVITQGNKTVTLQGDTLTITREVDRTGKGEPVTVQASVNLTPETRHALLTALQGE